MSKIMSLTCCGSYMLFNDVFNAAIFLIGNILVMPSLDSRGQGDLLKLCRPYFPFEYLAMAGQSSVVWSG